MQTKANFFATILAGMTKKAKIVMLGNPLPLAETRVKAGVHQALHAGMIAASVQG